MIPPLVDVPLTIDGRPVTVPAGATLLDAARAAGAEIPVLCHAPGLEPVGVCRVCVVEVEGARVLAPACVQKALPGQVVRTGSRTVRVARRTLGELLMADHPAPCERERLSGDCELEAYWRRHGNGAAPRFAPRAEPPRRLDDSAPMIRVDHGACILCDRCIRACDDVQVNLVHHADFPSEVRNTTTQNWKRSRLGFHESASRYRLVFSLCVALEGAGEVTNETSGLH